MEKVDNLNIRIMKFNVELIGVCDANGVSSILNLLEV